MLTERVIREAKPTGKARTIWDNKVIGLGLQITQRGRKNYVIRYMVGGRRRQAILARAGEVSLADIRRRAGDELVRVRAGEDDPLERQRKAKEAPTVADGLARFFDEYAPKRIEIGRLATSTLADYRWIAERYVSPSLDKRKAADVTRHHIEAMAAPLPNAMRNKTLAFASRLFSLFETWEWRPQHSNPCRNVERAREEPRDRTLAPDELAALAKALDDAEAKRPAPVAAIRVAALTGLRIGEVLAIQWEHVAFDTGRLVLPTTKTGRGVHDLPAPALEVMSALPRINPWVFTVGRDAPVTYRHARTVFADAAKAAGLSDVRLHDLRRTVMTRAAASGIGVYVLRDLLGHKTTAMADRYIRALSDPVREARQRVGDEVAAMMEGKSAEVVPIRNERG